MISINEYGGPRIERVPVYEKTNFDYALDLINNAAGTVTINYNTPIDGLELRFRTDDVVSNPLLPSAMNLVTIGSNTVSLHFDSGNMGKVKINGTASSNIELYDGAWLNLLLQKNGTNLDLFVKKPTGEPFDGWCWPGSCSWIDFTNPKAQEWWSNKFSLLDYYGSAESLYIWNDINEF
jgi:hypothetical protein